MDGGIPFTFAVFMRFLLAAVISVFLMWRSEQPLVGHLGLWRAWLIVGIFSGLSMLTSYWCLQSINSGLGAIIFFGMAPLATAFFAWRLLNNSVSRGDISSIALGMLGMIVIFRDSLSGSTNSAVGVALALASVLLSTSGVVLLKRYGMGLAPDAINNGSQVVRAVIAGLAWLASGAEVPESNPSSLAMGATVYMAVIGSVIAFSVYHKLVLTCRPIALSSISVVAPVMATWLGIVANGESTNPSLMAGSVLILLAMILHMLPWSAQLKVARQSS